jgi:hypothetical protein
MDSLQPSYGLCYIMLDSSGGHARPQKLKASLRSPPISNPLRRLRLTRPCKTLRNIPPPHSNLKPQHPPHNPRLPRRHPALHNAQHLNPIRQHPLPPPPLHRRNLLHRNSKYQHPPLPLPHPPPNIPHPHQILRASTNHRSLPSPHKRLFNVPRLPHHRSCSY